MTTPRFQRTFTRLGLFAWCVLLSARCAILAEPCLALKALAMMPFLGFTSAVACRSFVHKGGIITSCAALVVPCSVLASSTRTLGDITCIGCMARFRPRTGEAYRDFCNKKCEISYKGRLKGIDEERIKKAIEKNARKEFEKKMEEKTRQIKAEEERIRKKKMEEEERKRKEKERKLEEERKRREEDEKRKRGEKERKKIEERKKKEESEKKKREEELNKKAKSLSKEMEKMKIKERKLELLNKEKANKKLKEMEMEKLREGKRSISGQSSIPPLSCSECHRQFRTMEYKEFCSNKCENDNKMKMWRRNY